MKKRELYDCRSIEDGMAFVERKMKEAKIQKQMYNQNLLVTEEILTKIMEVEAPESIRIKTANNFGEYSIRFIFPCEKPFELINEADKSDISGRILSHYAERIKTQYRSGYSTVSVLVEQSYSRYARLSTLAAIVALLCAYLVIEFAPQSLCNFLENRLFWSIESMFTKAICLIATPVTFFCIAANIAKYSNLADRYPDIRKLVLRYLLTSIAALFIGFLIYCGVSPLISGIVFPEYQLHNVQILNITDIWLAISSMVPESILEPFITSATLPILLLAMISGIAVAMIDRQSGKVREGLDTIKSVFCKMLSIIFHFSPLIIFLCVFELVLYHGLISLVYEALCIVLVIFCCLVINASYAISLLCNQIKPIRILRTMWKSFWNVFQIGSTEAAIPDTIKDCAEKLNFPKHPLEISIPLGAEINMDGNCGVLMLLMMLLAKIAGVNLSMHTILILGIIILAISFGAPSQPGSITVGAMIILPQIGLRNDLITTALIVEIATSRFLALSNAIGDVVCAEIVGEKERRRVQKMREANEANKTKQ